MSQRKWSNRPDPHHQTTVDLSTVDGTPADAATAPPQLALTILHHPLSDRLGHRAALGDGGVPVAVSRYSPLFSAPDARPGHALECDRVSRTPVWLQRDGDALVVRSGGGRRPARLDGLPLTGSVSLPWSELAARGALLELGGCVLLWVHLTSPEPCPVEWRGMVGVSRPLRTLREQVQRVAGLTAAVLVRGESGSGKELVARALHTAGPRAHGPWVAVNMAAIPRSTATAELFGHGRGAFTGADRERAGWFEQADGGTLFLDEIGETPADIQPLLLRALDQGVIQPVGRPLRSVDARVVAATDADLEALVRAGELRGALLHRLRGAEITVPPLRERHVDVPLLLHRFLRGYLEELGSPGLLDTPDPGARPWLGTSLLVELMGCAFPGNVRQLRSAALSIAVHSHDQRAASIPAAALEELRGPPPAAGEVGAPMSEASVREALARNAWTLSRAAEALGISRNTLVAHIERSPDLRLPRDLGAPEIRAALEAAREDVVTAAATLEVSAHGLRLRMGELGLR